ncbi:hypothetical protein NL365_27620, partial [Klebsiella pneumoniae]|nr:hypothetical protein [Klebsiella pneumoniae]
MQIRRAPDGTGTDTLSITSKSHLLFAIPVSELEKQPADCRITTTVRADAGPSDPSVFVTATATTFAMSTADSDNPKTDSP